MFGKKNKKAKEQKQKPQQNFSSNIDEDIYASTLENDDDIYNSRTSLSLLDKNTTPLSTPGFQQNRAKGNILVKGDPDSYGNGDFFDDGRPTCCFGIFNTSQKKTENRVSKVEPGSMQATFLEIFEENLPKYASTMDWVREFIKLATKTLETQDRQIYSLRKEYES